MTGIEPAYSAWVAVSTPERVSENAQVEGLPDRCKVAIYQQKHPVTGYLRGAPDGVGPASDGIGSASSTGPLRDRNECRANRRVFCGNLHISCVPTREDSERERRQGRGSAPVA